MNETTEAVESKEAEVSTESEDTSARTETSSTVVEPRDEVEGRDYRVEGNDVSGYIGVDAEYMTYANETEKPILTSEEEWNYTNNLDHLEGNMDDSATENKEENTTDSDKTESETPATGETETEKDSAKGATFNAPVNVPGVITPLS